MCGVWVMHRQPQCTAVTNCARYKMQWTLSTRSMHSMLESELLEVRDVLANLSMPTWFELLSRN